MYRSHCSLNFYVVLSCHNGFIRCREAVGYLFQHLRFTEVDKFIGEVVCIFPDEIAADISRKRIARIPARPMDLGYARCWRWAISVDSVMNLGCFGRVGLPMRQVFADDRF